jgi:pyruvate/2-oxoglutarate/acetoin dehydrogenase E1 component
MVRVEEVMGMITAATLPGATIVAIPMGMATYGLDIVVKFKALSYFVSQIDEAHHWARSTFATQGSNIPSFIIIIFKIKY